jgi:hypothetical protein
VIINGEHRATFPLSCSVAVIVPSDRECTGSNFLGLVHCANGQQLKCLTVTDEFTKEGLAIDVDGLLSCEESLRESVHLGHLGNYPAISMLRCSGLSVPATTGALFCFVGHNSAPSQGRLRGA